MELGPTEEQGEDGTTSSRVRLRGAQGVAEVIQAPVGGAWLCDGPLSSPLACRARFAGCLFAFTAALLALASAAPLPHTCSQIDSTLAGCPPAVTGLTIGHTLTQGSFSSEDSKHPCASCSPSGSCSQSPKQPNLFAQYFTYLFKETTPHS